MVGAEVTLDDFGVTALVAARLRAAPSLTIVYTPSYQPDAFDTTATKPTVFATFDKLQTAQFDLASREEQIAKKKNGIAAAIIVAKKNEPCVEVLTADSARLDRLRRIAATAHVSAYYWLMADDQSGLTSFSLPRERLATNAAYVLQ